MTISSEIIKFATSRTSPFTQKEVLEYMATVNMNVTAGTLYVLLNRLVESGRISKTGRGLFSIANDSKPSYIYTPDDTECKVWDAVHKKFPFIDFCVWNANAITPFMQHVASSSFMLVDVERIAMDAVFQFLLSEFPKHMVLLNPSKSDCEHYLNMDNVIIVRPLIVEAPLSTNQGTNIPSIEKILVDIVSDKEFDYAGGTELYQIYKNAFEMVDVNRKKLLRYASRRNRKEKIEQILKYNKI